MTNNLIMAKDVAGNPVAACPNNPLLFNGILWPNATRRNDAERYARDQKALAEYYAKGGKVTQVDAAIGGVKTQAKLPRKYHGKPAAPKLTTGDKKFDMYLNALPNPVRVKVVPENLDPRELYKEYRVLGKAGLIAKYAPEAL